MTLARDLGIGVSNKTRKRALEYISNLERLGLPADDVDMHRQIIDDAVDIDDLFDRWGDAVVAKQARRDDA